MAPPLSFLSEAMIARIRTALSQRDYQEALECALTLASVDNNPKATLALSYTILDVIDNLQLTSQASIAKSRLIEAVKRENLDYNLIRSCCDLASVHKILDLTRSRWRWLKPRKVSAEVAARITSNLIRVISENDRNDARPVLDTSASNKGNIKEEKEPSLLFLGYLIPNHDSVVYAITFLLIAASVGLLIIAIPPIIYFIMDYFSSYPSETKQTVFRSQCRTVGLDYVSIAWNFIKSNEGSACLSGFIILHAILRYLWKSDNRETKELAYALLFLFISASAVAITNAQELAYWRRVLNVACFKPSEPGMASQVRRNH